MNKTSIIITFIISLLVTGGFWGYDYFFKKNERNLWEFVPSNAALVYEPQNGADSWKAIFEGDISKLLGRLPWYTNLRKHMSSLDSLAGEGSLDQIASNGNLLITVHPVSGSNFDFLYLMDVSLPSRRKNLNKVIEKIQGEKGLTLNHRNFNNVEIYDYTTRDIKGLVFSFASIEDFWFGSFSPFLVEDVIRQYTEGTGLNFQALNQELFTLVKIKNDQGNIFINYQHLSSLLYSFLDPNARDGSTNIASIGKSAFFDLNIDDESIQLSGFSFYASKDEFLGIRSNKVPGPSTLSGYIPSATAWVKHFLNEEFIQGDSSSNINFSALMKQLSGEIALVTLEASDNTVPQKLVFMRAEEIEAAREELMNLAKKAAENNRDTLYYELYSDYTITEINIKDFSLSLHQPCGFSSDRTYFTVVNDMIVLGTSLQAVKEFLLDIEEENTWGKSVNKSKFLTTTLEESNVNIYFDFNKTWGLLQNDLHKEWKQYFEEYEDVFRNIDLGALQYSFTDNKFYTNISLTYNPENIVSFRERKRLNADIVTSLSAAAFTKPKVTRNHLTNQREVIIQGTNNILSLISPTGEMIWEKQLGTPVKGDIVQLDYFRNGKLQYFMATDSALHIFDRNGQYLEGYPLKLPFIVDKSTVLDYDNSKNYRFLLSDIRGNLYMYDTKGVNLEGWQPNILNGKLAITPFHLRVRGKDCIVVVQENGHVNVLSRRGEMLKGFPLDLGPQLSSSYA
ncbi:MAG: hypothetical protein OEY51_13230, partial [Cyclobacteriaceae bacterium]|nr:hypothetical protein [Cyclobacteriaceae bacterium]